MPALARSTSFVAKIVLSPESAKSREAPERHEKDDRYLIDDRTRFVLGWSNEAKIAALRQQATGLNQRMQVSGNKISSLERQRASFDERIQLMGQLGVFEIFRDLDWKPLAIEIEDLEKEKRELEDGSTFSASCTDSFRQSSAHSGKQIKIWKGWRRA